MLQVGTTSCRQLLLDACVHDNAAGRYHQLQTVIIGCMRSRQCCRSVPPVADSYYWMHAFTTMLQVGTTSCRQLLLDACVHDNAAGRYHQLQTVIIGCMCFFSIMLMFVCVCMCVWESVWVCVSVSVWVCVMAYLLWQHWYLLWCLLISDITIILCYWCCGTHSTEWFWGRFKNE